MQSELNEAFVQTPIHTLLCRVIPSVLCWLGVRKSIRPVKIE